MWLQKWLQMWLQMWLQKWLQKCPPGVLDDRDQLPPCEALERDEAYGAFGRQTAPRPAEGFREGSGKVQGRFREAYGALGRQAAPRPFLPLSRLVALGVVDDFLPAVLPSGAAVVDAVVLPHPGAARNVVAASQHAPRRVAQQKGVHRVVWAVAQLDERLGRAFELRLLADRGRFREG